MEFWDILIRTDEPCIAHSLGGNALTIISQHKLTLPEEVVAVGDSSGSLRILKIPEALARPMENEVNVRIDTKFMLHIIEKTDKQKCIFYRI